MAITGLEIYKLLPKKNCRECGFPTCMAYAMALAGAKTTAEACPYMSDEAKAALGAAAEPPIRLVTVGTGAKKVELGDEHVLFRHEKTFYHPTAVTYRISDALSDEEIGNRIEQVKKLSFERVGLIIHGDLVALRGDSGSPERFATVAKRLMAEVPYALCLESRDPGLVGAALKEVGAEKPLIYGADTTNFEAMLALAKETGSALVLSGTLAELESLSEKAAAAGHRELVLAPKTGGIGATLRVLTLLRRLALKKKFRPFGYPLLVDDLGEDPITMAARASVVVAKYAGIVILDRYEPAYVLPILIGRQDLYTDPQKPIQVEAKAWEVGTAKENAPVYVTTNFSLSYFSVLAEVEASKLGSYVVTVDTDGTSVLTAYAAGKFGADHIQEAVEKSGVYERVGHRRLVIPGYVAVLSGKLNAATGWEVLVGPREATGIPSFIRARWKDEGGSMDADQVSAG